MSIRNSQRFIFFEVTQALCKLQIIYEVFSIHGTPYQIISYNRPPQFQRCNKEIKHFCKEIKKDLKCVFWYHGKRNMRRRGQLFEQKKDTV